MNPIWVVLATSCANCNTIALGVYEHEPNEADIATVNKAAGGMFCLSNQIVKSEINQAVVAVAGSLLRAEID